MQDDRDQNQEIDAAARFAGAVGHDVTNILSVIHGFAELIQLKNRDNPELLRSIEEILQAAKRGTELSRELLTFSQPREPEPQEFDLNQRIRDMQEMLRRIVGRQIRIQLQNVAQPLRVWLDPASLEQITVSLCANARDAMRDGGTLTIETGAVTADGVFCEAHRWAKSGNSYIRLSVHDTGVGMDPSMVPYVFEPFFVKKKLNRGTGLELAVVYQLIKQQGGHVEVEADPAHGTTFHLYFPREVSG